MPKNFARVYFLLFGLLDLSALVTAFLYSLNYIVDYFSYFTVLSNILITFVFLSFGVVGRSGKVKKSLAQRVYVPTVLYMCITGIVFWTILKGGALSHHMVILPWVNIVLHGITPIVAIVGFLLFPPEKKLEYSHVWKWLVFPVIFVAYTLFRGPIAHWYPYIILNPATAGGYLGVTRYFVEILAGSYILGIILVFLRSFRKGK